MCSRSRIRLSLGHQSRNCSLPINELSHTEVEIVLVLDASLVLNLSLARRRVGVALTFDLEELGC